MGAGCRWLISDLILVDPVVTPDGTADVPLGGLPNDPRLVGAKFFFQFFPFDPSLPTALPFSASNGAEIRFGASL